LTSADRALAGPDRVPGAVFALLVVACFAAFFVTQRLKHTPTAVQRFELTPFFSPTPGGRLKLEEISFKLSHADEVTVTIVDSSGNDVATLVRDWSVARYKQFSLRWNGRRGRPHGYQLIIRPDGHRITVPRNRGSLAPPGEYRVRVTLLGKGGREIYSPWSFTLEGR
jgi:hypothetical protein